MKNPTLKDFEAVSERLTQYGQWLNEHDPTLKSNLSSPECYHLNKVDVLDGDINFQWYDSHPSGDRWFWHDVHPEDVFCDNPLELILQRKEAYLKEQAEKAACKAQAEAERKVQADLLKEQQDRETYALLKAKFESGDSKP